MLVDVLTSQDKVLKKIINSKYKLVLFGASTASKRSLNILENINKLPDYICDNDVFKQGNDFYGYKVYKPEELFTQNFKFIVIISSMYYSQIKVQLNAFVNIKESIFYLDFIKNDLTVSIKKDQESKALESYNYNTDIKLSVLFTNTYDKEETFFLIKSYGLYRMIEYSKEDSFSCFNYLSYCNKTILDDQNSSYLKLIDSQYNFNERVYKFFLEYYLFSRYENNTLDKELLIDNVSLLRRGELLKVSAKVLKSFSKQKLEIIQATQTIKKTKEHALILHLFHYEMLGDIAGEMKSVGDVFDVYISINYEFSIEEIKQVLQAFPKANIFIFENRGRDVLPFLKMLKKIEDLNYQSFCKVHTKKSIYRTNGKEWGAELRTRLFKAKDEIIEALVNKREIGLFVAKGNLVSIDTYLDANKCNIEFLSKLLNIKYNENFDFPIGTMFWCRSDAIKQLFSTTLKSKYFLLEAGSIDGQLEHAVEMFMGLLIKANGYEIKEV